MVKNQRVLLKRDAAHVIAGSSDILIGRPEGEQLAKKLVKALEAAAPDVVIPVDFRNIRAIDFSCADEFVTKVLRRIMSGELGTRFIVLQGMSENVEESIQAVLTIREL